MVKSPSLRKSNHCTSLQGLRKLREDMIKIFEMPVRRTYELLGNQLSQLRANKKIKVKVSHTSNQSLWLRGLEVCWYLAIDVASTYSTISGRFTNLP
jgi:hypothetical protein